MAEVLGAISAGTGIATFLVQVGKGIKTVRSAINYNRHQASADLQALEADLGNLQNEIEKLQSSQNTPLVTLAISKCQQTYTEIEPDLYRLMQAFRYDQPQSRLKSFKKHLNFKSEENVKRMRTKVSHVVDSLILISILLNQHEDIHVRQTGPVADMIANVGPVIEPTSSQNTPVAGSSSLGNETVALKKRAKMRTSGSCSHIQTSYTNGRFWWLELTSTPGFWHECGTRCPTQCEWNAKLRLALTWLNIPFAVTASLGFTSRNGQYSLRPALSIQHVVKNTSPGFEALYLCEVNVISLEESKQRLRDLYRTDRHFKYHVNPAGEGYLRHLVSGSGPWCHKPFQLQLLDFFFTELGMDFSSEDPGFLIDCSKWIGEGPHLDLLDIVLEHGFAPSAVEPPAANQWPTPHDPNWISESSTPDPFFVDYFASIVSYEPGFTGVTEIQKCILTDTFHTLLNAEGELSKLKELLSAVNFLGQTSLHLAVNNFCIVKELVELGHELDVTDQWGTTPLMYAAAMGYEDTTVHLLLMGANPGLRETRYKRTFFDFAITRGHWSLIHKALATIQDLYPEQVHHVFAHLIVFRAMTSRLYDVTGEVRRQHIPLVMRHCDDVNFSFADSQDSVTGNNLLHYVHFIEEAEALISCGFNLFNKPNSAGRLPIHSSTFDPSLIRFCIEHGTSIDHVDANGQTLLLVLLSRLGGFSLEDRTTLRQIRCCLDLGADPNHSDDCRCPCSPSGCSSSAFFTNGFDSGWTTSGRPCADIFWVFEWLSILQDIHGVAVAKDFLLSFIRRIKFDELDMTHVCCHEGSGIPLECLRGLICDWYPKRMDNEDICDILEEEDEFIDILEQTMSRLALKSVNELQRYLLEILKEKHEQHLQRNAEERAKRLRQTSKKPVTSDVQWHVDYKKDKFWQQIPSADSYPPSDYSLPRNLASYIVYIDLEYRWLHGPVSQKSEKELWYGRRMRLVKEITEVFGLSIDKVLNCMDDAVTPARLDMDENAVKRIKDRTCTFYKNEGLGII